MEAVFLLISINICTFKKIPRYEKIKFFIRYSFIDIL